MDPYNMKGYVYLLTDSEFYKIGVTRGSIDKRIGKLQTGNPNDISIVKYHATEHPFKLEKMLHNKYKLQNVNNEWFSLSLEDINNFESVCNNFEDIIIALKDNPFF